ncbi:MAG: 3-deoxy-8-phosphooctulonate synthase [Verrucomicrobiae bacterium]|nr:3-deoxy-8-phosphooctulonate synthase [Verrucomicrobiae bacterium]
MLFDSEKLLLIAGPCSLESLNTCEPVAKTLLALQKTHPELNLVFKGSFDKANRTSIEGARGTGIDEGLELLQTIKQDFGLPVTTDIHQISQVEPVARVVDILQIPAFLCRQTDLLLAAAESGRVVNVKKGQFLAPQDMYHVAGKLEEGGAAEIWLTERGTTFGYRNLVVDMRCFDILKHAGYPVVFDATHSVQLPGGGGGKSDGQREFVPALARAALAAGAKGIFVETHPDPDHAISDGPNMIPLDALPDLVAELVQVWKLMKSLAKA